MPENLIVRRTFAAVLLSICLSAAMTYYHLGLFIPHAVERRATMGLAGGYSFGNDFYPIWLTARELDRQHSSPYSTATTREIQMGLFGHAMDTRNPLDPPAEYRTFAYPLYVDLMFWPLSLLPFPVTRVLAAIILAALTAISIPLWLSAINWRVKPSRLVILILFTFSSYAVLEGLFAVQVGLLAAFLLAASFWALRQGRLFTAGSLFAFTLIKPQVSVVVGLYLALWSLSRWRERRRFACAFLAWSAALAGSSFLVLRDWIPQWLHVLSGYGKYAPPALITYSLGPKYGPEFGPYLIAVLLVVAAIVAWQMRRTEPASPEFMAAVSLLLALTSITLLPGQAVYDHVILLPAILVTARSWRAAVSVSRPFAAILAAGAIALFWQWIVVVPLLVARYLLPPEKFFSDAIFLLPLHAAASIPLAMTAILGFLMWKGIRNPSIFRGESTGPPIH